MIAKASRWLTLIPAILAAGSAGAQDLCGLAAGAQPVRIVAEGAPLRIEMRSGDVVHARAISLSGGTARLESESLGLLEVSCALIAAARPGEGSAPAADAATSATVARLSAAEAGAIRGRGPSSDAPDQARSAGAVVIRPDLQEALRRAELLRNPDSLQLGAGRFRLTTGLNVGLSGRFGDRSREVGLSQQVTYGWTDRFATFGTIGFSRLDRETASLSPDGTVAVVRRSDGGVSSMALGASYALNNPTRALPTFTLSGNVAFPARAPRTLGAQRVGEGYRSGTLRLEAGREYDSVSWTAAVFATAFLPETVAGAETQPGLRSGVELFGSLMLNDRHSVFSTLTFTDVQRTTVDGRGVAGTDQQHFSMGLGFTSELARDWYLSGRVESPIGNTDNLTTVGVAVTREF